MRRMFHLAVATIFTRLISPIIVPACQLVCRAQDVRTLRSRQFPEDAGPLAHPIRPESYIAMDNFYTATVYVKGAEV